jgi:hypothetical protein
MMGVICKACGDTFYADESEDHLRKRGGQLCSTCLRFNREERKSRNARSFHDVLTWRVSLEKGSNAIRDWHDLVLPYLRKRSLLP